MPSFPILIAVCANPDLRDALGRLAKTNGSPNGVGDINRYVYPGKARIDLSKIPREPVAIAFVDITADPEAGLYTATYLAQNPSPKIYTVAVAKDPDADTVMAGFRAGCADFVRWPADDKKLLDVIQAVALKAVQQQQQPAVKQMPQKKGRLVMFVGARGGVGTTTVAVHTALALTPTLGDGVLLADVHRQLGHVSAYMDLTNPGYSYLDMIDSRQKLDDDLLKSYLVRHKSGLSVLCSPDNYSALADIAKDGHDHHAPADARAINDVLSHLQDHFELTIVDADPRLPETFHLAQQADLIFFVAGADVGSMRDASRYADIIQRDNARHSLIITRTGKGVVTPAMASETINLPLCASIPDLAEQITAATNTGTAVPPKLASFHDAITAIVRKVDARALVDDKKKSGGLFGGFRKAS